MNALVLAGGCALSLLITVTVFLGLQAAVLTLTSDARIIAHLSRSLDRGTLSPASYPISPYGRPVDNWTDCVALGVNLGNADQPLLRRLAATPYLGESKDVPPCATLARALMEDEVHATTPYFRYWQGHQVYLRPLLMFADLDRVHILNAILLFGAIMLLCIRLNAWFGCMAGLIFAFALVWHIDVLSVPATSTHSLSLAWIYLSVAIVGRALQRGGGSRANLILVFFTGSVASYFDILFNPPLAPALIGFLAMSFALMREPDAAGGPRTALMDGGLCVVFWFAGFGLAWASKWVFAALVLGLDEVVSNVQSAIELRAGLSTHIDMFTATLRNYDPYRRAAPFWWLAAAILLLRARIGRNDFGRFVLLLLPLLVPVLWFELVREHSATHGFVPRTFVLICILPVLAALAVLRRRDGRTDGSHYRV